MDFDQTDLTVDGCRIGMLRGGAGAPLLFLHGLTGGGVRLPVMDRLAERFDVIAPEHPGYGASDMPEWLDSISDMAYFYLDVLAELDFGPVHVVGASIGGWIAAEMAVRDPSVFRSMTLAAPAGISVKGVRKGDLFMWSADETLRRLFHDPARAQAMPQAEGGDALLTLLKNRETTARLGWNPRLHNPDLRKWLHRAAVPTLIVWGAEDALLPVEMAPAYRDLIPGAQLEILQACGHLPHVEQADAFADRALDFIGAAA